MDPSQPSEPAQPAPPSEPLVPWRPSPEPAGGTATDGVTGALFGNKPAALLTVGDALSTGLSIIQKPTFIVPVLVIGVVVHSVINLLLRPLMQSSVTVQNGDTLSGAQIGAIAGSLLVSVVVGIVGGVLLNLYAQIWAVEATAGPLPSTDSVVALARKRWLAIIGTGLVVAAISIALLVGLLIVVGVLAALLAVVGVLAFFVAIVVFAYVAARLSMAGWLAAAGGDVMESINGSWRITNHNLLRIIGWGLAYGIVFGIVGGVLGAVLGLVPIVGPAVATTIQAALGYGGGVTLFRRTQAAAMGGSGAAAPTAPPAPTGPADPAVPTDPAAPIEPTEPPTAS
jgi:hypothetical protein